MIPKINNKQFFSILLIFLLAIVFALGVIWLAQHFPMKPETKDWLDILSATGEAAGVVVLIGLVIELSRLRSDTIARQTPDVRIFAEIVDMDKLPQGNVSLAENTQPFSNFNQSDGRYDADYVEAWKSLDNTKVSHLIRVEVVNKSDSRDAIAKDFKIKLELNYGNDENKLSFLLPRTVWVPLQGIEIPNGNEPVYVYIKCAPLSIKGVTYVTGKILDYKCVNLKGDSAIGSKQKFTPVTIIGRTIA